MNLTLDDVAFSNALPWRTASEAAFSKRIGTRLLGKLVPVIIALMMDNPNALWGDAVYPVVAQDA
jgi:hypothetical protein